MHISFEDTDVIKRIRAALPGMMGFEIIDQGEDYVEISCDDSIVYDLPKSIEDFDLDDKKNNIKKFRSKKEALEFLLKDIRIVSLKKFRKKHDR